MSDVQFLFAILGVLYVWECACWLRRGGVAFSTWTGRGWRYQHPAMMLGNQNAGFVLAAPVPPLGTIFTAHQLPCSLGPEGVLLFVSPNMNPGWRPAQSARFFRWDQLAALRVQGKKLLLNRERILTTPSPTFAHYLQQEFTRLTKISATDREPEIQKILQSSFNLTRIEKLRSEFGDSIRPIRFAANVLLILVFVIAPLLIGFIGLELVWGWLLLGVLGLTITTATYFHKLHREFFPNAADERFTQTLLIALAPATTMRAHDSASRPLLESFHPLAIAKNLLAPGDFQLFARRLLRDLRHPVPPLCPNAQPEAIATEAFYRRTLLTVTETWLSENQIVPGELCQPPPPTDESCRAYCPRCEAQFTSPAGGCADCGGVPLVAFGNAS